MKNLFVQGFVSGRNQEPYVQIMLDGKVAQFTPDEARSVALQLFACADAATSDAFLVHFMGGIGKRDANHDAQIGGLLTAFRDYRDKLRAKGDPLQWGELAEWPEPPKPE